MVDKELKLKVAEAIQDDVNKGIVRIDSGYLSEVEIKAGDIVEIEGERKTVAIADRSYPGDIGLNIIRMDGIIRKNSKTGIGEIVKVRKATVKEAKKIIIAPARKGIVIRASPEIFKQGLLGRAVVRGDIVSLGGARRRKTTMMNNPFFDEDIFSILDESMMGIGFGDIKFVVVDTNPKQAVIILDSTEIEFRSEAVEIEEERVPDITYEDVGGLEDEIKKVREMVELPLKHPEIFERLGIEAPKGVLLHGPPGTGKTLLAKAVANETNSHFILINGPEIMCVDGDTKILTNPKGSIKAKNIFDNAEIDGKIEGDKVKVVELKKPISTFSYDKNGKISKAKITHVTKLKAPSYEVEFSDGNKLTVSKNQPFLVYKNGNLVWKRLEELKEGCLVAKINYVKVEERSYKINFSIENLIKRKGYYTIKSRNLSRSNWIRLPQKTSPELMEFLGLVMSDGNIDKKKESITFTNNDATLRRRFQELLNKLFGVSKSKEYGDGRVVVYSKLLSEYANKLGIDAGKKESRIPTYMFKLPKNEIESFVKGYFDGDGCAALTPFTTKEGKKSFYPTPKIFCKSREFLQELQSLMQMRLRISTKLNPHQTPKGMMHELAVRGYDGRKKFLSIGSSSSKLDKIKRINLNQKMKEFENIPVPTYLVKSIKEKMLYKNFRNNDYYIYGKGKFTRYSMNKLFNLADKNQIVDNILTQEYNLLNRNDIGWEQIKKINFVGEKELYDFTVDKDSFVTQNLLLLHNSKYYGQSEENLRKKFEEAEKNAPSIIFIDEIDAIASKREETRGEVERRVVAQLLALMDGLQSRGKVVVIAATNVPNILDPALRRPGRFDREIEIGVPGKEGRLNILKIHTRNMPMFTKENLIKESNFELEYKEALLNLIRYKDANQKSMERTINKYLVENPEKNDLFKKIDISKLRKYMEKINYDQKIVHLKELAEITHGFVGADLASLAKEAAMIVLRRVLPDIKLKEDEPLPKELLERLVITQNDFKESLKVVRPSALREVLVEIPNIKWADIGGLINVKQELIEAVEWPLKHPEAFKRLGVRPPRGILLFGAPGTGKTLLAKAVANESEANFILVKGPELLSMYVGESEKAVRQIFKKARQVSPCIIFFDEVDALAPRRGLSSDSHVSERVVNQLLTEIDGLEDLHDVVVIAASVTGDTPILIKDRKGDINLTPIAKFVDKFYEDNEKGAEKSVNGYQCLGFDSLTSKTPNGLRFGNSAFKDIRGVFRHKVDEIYEINFLGGIIRTTGNHSVFVRTKNGIKAKPVSQLKAGEYLVELPYKVNRTNKNLRSIRSHIFNDNMRIKIPIFDEDNILKDKYNFVVNSQLPQSLIAKQVGVSQGAVSLWQRNISVPRALSKKYFKHLLPEEVPVTQGLMRLFGYYTAEGYARKEIDFCFNIKENLLINDLQELMEGVFGLRSDTIKINGNAINIVYYSKPIAKFFSRYCGKGAHNKHLPPFLFTASREYFLEFLKGYVAGDGHQNKSGGIEVTSVGKQLILELNWLCRMHGIKSYISKFTAKEGRRINNGRPLKAVQAYRLGITKHDNPFSTNQFSRSKRTIIKSINRVAYNGYVYDLCGCDNEAFFGGETPLLLHNTNRPDIVDTALMRPGRFDRMILTPIPDEQTRLEIFKVHAKGMPISVEDQVRKKMVAAKTKSGEVSMETEIESDFENGDIKSREDFLKYLAKKTDGYVGADIESVCREAAILALREDINSREIMPKHFEKSLRKVRPSVTPDVEKAYEELQEHFTAARAKQMLNEKPEYMG